MIKIAEAVEALERHVRTIADAEEPEIWFDTLVQTQPLTLAVTESLDAASAAECAEAARRLRPLLQLPDPQVSGQIALLLGVFVERGLPTGIVGREILLEFGNMLELYGSFVSLIRDEIPATEEEPEDDEGGYWVEDRFVTEVKAQEFWLRDRRLPQTLAGLESWILPVVAILSRDHDLRQNAQADSGLVKLTEEYKIPFVRNLLKLLDKERIVVLHPMTEQGFEIVLDGITDNFQLHTLLADALILEKTGWFKSTGPAWGIAGKRPHPETVAMLKGDKSKSPQPYCEGVWDFYEWTALKGNEQLKRSVPPDKWIWNEGIPSDIPKFEDTRVIVLGTPSYQRTWGAGRQIPALKASITVTKVFNTAEYRQWTDRLKNG
jgi:hypothetical protein